MDKKYDILTFADLCADLILTDRDISPEFGQKEKLVSDYSLQMGGSCGIFAAQAGKLGLKVSLIGRTGDDQFGRLIIDTLVKSGVGTEHIIGDPTMKTGLTVILNKIDDRAMLTYNGTIDGVGEEDINEELLASTRHFHIGSYYLMKKIQPFYPRIVSILKRHGATISLDTNWDPEEKWGSGLMELLHQVDIFLPNENEAMAITGEDSPEKAIGRLKDIVPCVAVKKGKDGAVAYSGGKVYAAEPVDVPKVDAVGAGDSFDAGFVYGFLNKKPIEVCTRIGCICGSLNVRAAGGTKGQPSLEEMLGYLE